MSWGIRIKNAVCPRVHKSEIRDKIAEDEIYLDSLEDRLLILAATTPHPKTEDGETWEEHVITRVPELCEEIKETAGRLMLLYQAEANMDDVEEF